MNARRAFLLLLPAGVLLPRWAAAQRSTGFRVGWISLDWPGTSPFLDHFRAGLRDLGYVEGRNLMIDARWAEGSRERLDQLAAELVRSNPHVIATHGGPATYPVVRAGATMPVVFSFSGDPVEGKLVESFARPGRNLTGVSLLSLELVGKRIELLRETIPGLKRIAIIARPEHPGEQGELRASQAAARATGVALDYFPIRGETELDKALAAIPTLRCEAMVAFPDATMMRYSERIAAMATKNRIPAISGWAEFTERGNLMSYGPNLAASFRRLAYFVDRILKGAKPADLPVELPTKFELVVNTKAAKELGIIVPPSILVRADRVIE